jgi:hypothetical protein
MTNVFVRRKYVFFYFEFFHFSFWGKDYLKNIYPEINLIMILEINDSKLSQEKVYYYRSDDFTNYTPMKTKKDANLNAYRCIIPFEFTETEKPFKIAISFYTYTNHKLLTVCNEEVFIKYNKDFEMQKYTLYQNVYLKHYNKKIGNSFFNFAYKSEEIGSMSELESIKESLYDKFYVILIKTET